MNNRNPVKSWAITFPQSGDVERKDFTETFPPFHACLCARELHQDGGNHLHLGIKLKKGVTKKTLLNWIAKKWPNDYMRIDVQATRSIQQWGDYLKKEDPDTFEIGEDGRVRERPPSQGEIWQMLLDQMEAGRASRFIANLEEARNNEEMEREQIWMNDPTRG